MNFKTRRTIRVEIESRLRAGESKQAVYDELRSRGGDEAFIRKVLSEVPSLEARDKYRRLNRILMILLLAIALVKTGFFAVGSPTVTPGALLWLLLPIGIQLLLIQMIHGFNRMSYLIAAIYGGLQLLDYIPGNAAADPVIKLFFAAIQFFWAVAVALSVFLYFKLKENGFNR